MDPSRYPAPPLLLAAAGVLLLLCAAALPMLGAPPWLRTSLPALLGAGALFAAAAGVHRLGRGRAALENRLAVRDREASQLRHDLRGILSPAMLTADRLTTSADPVVRRAGETMVATVERAEQRLRGNPAPST